MNKHNISKKAIIVIAAATAVISACAAGIIYFIACSHLNIPEVTITAENGASAQAIRGGFEWSSCGRHTLADSLSPLDFDYKAENIITVKKGSVLTVNSKKANRSKAYPFTVAYLTRYTGNRTPAQLDTNDYNVNNGNMSIKSPDITGEYIFDLTLKYKQGTVNFGFKVIVTDDGLPAASPAESTEGNIIDAEYWFPMNSHLHTFSFDGKEFTPENNFMAENSVISDLDASVYFETEALCTYARKLSALSENQIDQIASYNNIKTIKGKNYINLIDLRSLGVYTVVGWELSSHTPVMFSSKGTVGNQSAAP